MRPSIAEQNKSTVLRAFGTRSADVRRSFSFLTESLL